MPAPLSILSIEDQPTDTEIILFELRQWGLEVTCTRVDTEEAFLAHLSADLDIILADYALPRFSALRALELLRQRGLDIPFIIVSGAIGEETAVAAMRQGATDYLLKDQLGRLGQAVTQAVEARRLREEKRRAEEAARAEQAFRAAVERSVAAGITAVDLQGRQTHVNPAFCAMVGWREEELVGATPPFVYWAPEAHQACAAALQAMLDGCPAAGGVEVRYRRRDGSRLDALLVASPLKDAEGSTVGWLTAVHDITPRKQSEEALAWASAVNAALAKLSRALIETASIDEMSRLILQHACTLTGSRIGFIGYIDPQTGRLVCPVRSDGGVELCPADSGDEAFHGFHGLWGWVATHRQSLMTNQAAADPRAVGVPPGHLPIERLLAVPALQGNTLVGQIALANADRDYTERDVAVVERLAALYAIALHHQRSADAIHFQARLLDAVGQAVVATDATGAITYWSPAAERLCGWSRSEALGRPITEVMPIDGLPRQTPETLARLQADGNCSGEFLVRRRDGTAFPAIVTDAPILDAEGRLTGMIGVSTDITELKQAEQELRRANRALRMLSACNQALVHATDEQNLLNQVCQFLVEDGGYQVVWIGIPADDDACSVIPVAVAGLPPAAMRRLRTFWGKMELGVGPTGTTIRTGASSVCRDLAHCPECAPWQDLASAQGICAAVSLPLANKSEVLGALTLYATEPDTFDAQEVALLEELAEDLAYGITALRMRLQHEQEEETRARLAAIIEAMPHLMASVDAQGRLLTLNAAGRELLGLGPGEAITGLTLADLYPERVRAQIQGEGVTTALREGSWSTETVLQKATGEEVAVLQVMLAHKREDGSLEFLSVIAQDISQSKRLEAELRQAQRMEAIGRLASGVAHDINNLLTPIMTYSELLNLRLADHPGLRSYTEQITSIAERAAALPRQLLAFSRKQVLQPEVLDLNRVVGDMEKLLRRTIGETITLQFTLDPALGRVKADPSQLEQVVLNLAVNARDAMPQGGVLSIWTANAEFSGSAGDPLGVRPGPYVVLTVRDTGCGMDEATATHIFEPFFTTKEPGRGTGLGLSTAYGIVKQSGGEIEVETQPGKGSTFRIYLPRVAECAAAGKDGLESGNHPHGSETVLLVEDEEAVREAAREFLQLGGYTVLTAADGWEGLQMAAEHSGPIHLLVTDVVMPRMSGRELVEHLRSMRPETRVIYISGYTEDAILHHGVLGHGVAFLQKPFTPGALARKVRAVLDPPEAALPGEADTN